MAGLIVTVTVQTELDEKQKEFEIDDAEDEEDLEALKDEVGKFIDSAKNDDPDSNVDDDDDDDVVVDESKI